MWPSTCDALDIILELLSQVHFIVTAKTKMCMLSMTWNQSATCNFHTDLRIVINYFKALWKHKLLNLAVSLKLMLYSPAATVDEMAVLQAFNSASVRRGITT